MDLNDFETKLEVHNDEGAYFNLTVDHLSVNVHQKEGTIIPMLLSIDAPVYTTYDLQKNMRPTLVVFRDINNEATGQLLMEDGVSKIVYDPKNVKNQKFNFIQFKYAKQVITFSMPYGDPAYRIDGTF